MNIATFKATYKVDVNREWWPPVDRMQVVGDKREREKSSVELKCLRIYAVMAY